jgi:hypothetical protein
MLQPRGIMAPRYDDAAHCTRAESSGQAHYGGSAAAAEAVAAAAAARAERGEPQGRQPAAADSDMLRAMATSGSTATTCPSDAAMATAQRARS